MKPTHTGALKGCDARTPEAYSATIKLRETKLYYVSEWGTKYKKSTGNALGQKWPLYYLSLDTVKPLEPTP